MGSGLVILGIALLGYMKIANKNFNALALDVLTFVKNTKGNRVKFENMTPSRLDSLDHILWDRMLKKYVSSEGKVDYVGFQSSVLELSEYLGHLSQNPPAAGWSKEDKLSYWINAYNAFTVQLILNHYPLKSIKDISNGLPMLNSPWDISFFKIGGVDFDLNTIEHEVLRKQFDEPRIHFAINCASISCPKLRNEAYLPSKLESQLDDQAQYFIHNRQKNQIDKSELKLSKIFNWFQSDFTKQGSLHSYLRNYAPAINDAQKIDYLDYNWTLNN